MPSLASERPEAETAIPAASAPSASLPFGFAALPGAGAISKLGAAVRSVLPAAFQAKPQPLAPPAQPKLPELYGLDSLTTHLWNTKSPNVLTRQNGVIGLMLDHPDSPETLPALLGLGNDPSQDVRETVVAWLGSFPASREALVALAEHAQDETSWSIRRSAARSLGAFLPSHEARAVLTRLQGDDQHYVRKAATEALEASYR